jgi:ATP-dependent DNA ligase
MNLPVRPPIKPMLAKIQTDIPVGDDWVYEPKWDGFRTLAFKDGNDVLLRSRNDRPMNRYFPDIEQLLADELPEKVVVDGEIIMPTDDGLDFDELQLRLHPAASRVKMLAEQTPASFVIFDVLAHNDDDLRPQPLRERLQRLDELFDKARPAVARDPSTQRGPVLHLTPCTDDADVAAEWFDDLEKVHLDGIIAKRTGLPYVEGERVMIKVKHRRTADCVVGGYRPHKQGGVGSLLLGLYDGDELRYIGHTSSFSTAARHEAFDLLQPLRGKPSFTFEGDWGPGGQSRWSQGKDTEWVSVEPTLVCEVSYDYVQSGHRFRHAARFLRWRDDKRPDECLFDQLSMDV